MPVRHKTKKQYVEHNEEYVGEDMKPFVALLMMQENQIDKNADTSFMPSVTANAQPNEKSKRKVRLWRRVTTFFS